MANSLLDFGGAAQNMIAMGNYLQNQRRNDLTEQNIDLTKKQQDINQQSAITDRINALGSVLKDDRFRLDPQLEGSIVNNISQLAGGPKVDLSTFEIGRQTKMQYAQGLMSGNRKQVHDAVVQMVATMPVDKLDDLVKSVDGYDKLHEDVLKMKQEREVNASKFEALQDNNAMVSYGRPMYTSTSSAFRNQLKMTDTKDYKAMQAVYEKTKTNGGDLNALIGSSQIPGVNKSALAGMLDGQFGDLARKADANSSNLLQQVNADRAMLDDADHGVPLPDGVSRSMLKARIETNSVIAGAYKSMQAWYEEPFDKAKHAEAQAAAHTLEQRRLDIESLDKNTQADTVRIQQETLAFNKQKEQFKNDRDSALADAQTQYASLPSAKQTPQEAARIARAVKESTGQAVLPEDITKAAKNPNAPLVNIDQRAENAGSLEYAKQFSKGIVDTDVTLYKRAQDAPDLIQQSQRLQDILRSKEVFTGAGADLKLSIAKALKAANLIDGETAADTETLFAGLATNTLSHIKESGLGSGNGFTDKDLRFLQDASGGRIGLEKNAILNILRLSEKAGVKSIEKWNDRAKTIPESALSASGLTRKSLQVPQRQSKSTASSGAVIKSLPQGSRQIGTSGGKPVYQGPDGRKWIGE